MPESMFLWDEDYFRVLLLESRPRLGAEEDDRVQAFRSNADLEHGKIAQTSVYTTTPFHPGVPKVACYCI